MESKSQKGAVIPALSRRLRVAMATGHPGAPFPGGGLHPDPAPRRVPTGLDLSLPFGVSVGSTAPGVVTSASLGGSTASHSSRPLVCSRAEDTDAPTLRRVRARWAVASAPRGWSGSAEAELWPANPGKLPGRLKVMCWVLGGVLGLWKRDLGSAGAGLDVGVAPDGFPSDGGWVASKG